MYNTKEVDGPYSCTYTSSPQHTTIVGHAGGHKVILRHMLLLLLLSPAQAWWDTGHMLTAAIALKSMNKAQVDEASKLLVDLPGYSTFASNFISASHWADDIKRNGDAYAFSNWHFIDMPFPNVSSCSVNTITEQNIVTALEGARKNLVNASVAGWTRAFSLRFVLHLMGDIHQPLHTTSRCTSKHPKGDYGGNSFKLADKEFTNLHKFWDSCGGQYANTIAALCPYSNPDACVENESRRVAAVMEEADRLMLEFPAASLGEDPFNKKEGADNQVWSAETFMGYAKTSFSVVEEGWLYGEVEENTLPTEAYVSRVRSTTRERIATGGYRLASLLNANLVTSSGCRASVGNGGSGGGLIVGFSVFLSFACVGLIAAVVFLCSKMKQLRSKDERPPFTAL